MRLHNTDNTFEISSDNYSGYDFTIGIDEYRGMVSLEIEYDNTGPLSCSSCNCRGAFDLTIEDESKLEKMLAKVKEIRAELARQS